MDPIDQKRGEPSVLWFRKTLSPPVNYPVPVNGQEAAESTPLGPTSSEDVAADSLNRDDA
jgi:hypothetical protein